MKIESSVIQIAADRSVFFMMGHDLDFFVIKVL